MTELDEFLDKYCNKWTLTDTTKLDSTHTSVVYRVTRKNSFTVLKLLNSVGRKHEATAPAVLKHFNRNGAVGLAVSGGCWKT